MDEPGQVNAAGALVKPVEDQAAGKQAGQGQSQDGGVKPAEHHGRVVEGEGRRAEAVGGPASGLLFERQEGVAPEKEFLQQGIDKGDIEGDPQEILPVDAGFRRQIGCQRGEIEHVPEQEEGGQNDRIHGQARRVSDPYDLLPSFLIDCTRLSPECQRIRRRIGSGA